MSVKKYLLLIVLISFNKSFSQQKVASFRDNTKHPEEIFKVIDEDNNQATLFFIAENSITATKFDESFQKKEDLQINFGKKELKTILGYSRSGDQYFIYWNGAQKNEIVAQHFDFVTKQTSSKIIPLDTEQEKFVDEFTANNIFYQIKILKGSNLVNVYKFSDGKVSKHVVDCSTFKFLSKTQQRITLYDLIQENNGAAYSTGIANISDETPASIVLGTEKKKSYTKGDQVTFTFDNNKSFTQTLSINLSTFSPSQNFYNTPFVKLEPGENSDSNSLLVNNRLVQLRVKGKVLKISVKDLDDNVIKEFSATPDEEVSFKNSEIIQENGSIASTRILGRTNQLIRKMHYLNAAVSGYYLDDTYYLTIGGVSYEKQDSSVLAGAMVGGLAGALIMHAITSNYSSRNLNSYQNKKIVYIHSLFDKDFNHIQGEYKKLAFDKLRLFVEENDKLKNHTIFKLNKDLYLFALNSKTNEFNFYKFQE